MNSRTTTNDSQEVELTPTGLRQYSVRFFIRIVFYLSMALLGMALLSPAANAANHTVTVKVKGNVGAESAYLNINGSRITAWQVSNTFKTFSYTTTEDVKNVRVGLNSGSWPNALVVDYIEVDGFRYESENPTTWSFNSWNSSSRCEQGYKRSEWLSCNGAYFDYAIDSSAIAVRARGNQGTESVDLIVNGSAVAAWPVMNNNQVFEYRTNQ